ncbi:MAG: hypothetical protein K8M05_16790, partial [Deltaproteobacteria bacterium]|nr:hypothetical protein [Kofleriaceae bacterium]
MPQVIEFPSLGAEARQQLLAFLKIARETPPAGESFTAFRSRLRAAKLWDRERPAVPLRFLGASGPTVVPSPFMQALAAAKSDDDALDLVADRLLELNPLLFKTVVELIEQRPHGKDEVSKYLGSFAYRGKPPSRPDLESFFLALIVAGVARVVGIALVPGARAERLKATLAGLDVDELLENPTPLPEPVIPGSDEEGDAPAPVADAGTAAM